MALTLNNDSKNTLAIANESKPTGGKWNSDATRTWGDGGTWGQPGTFLAKEAKSTLTITNETKT